MEFGSFRIDAIRRLLYRGETVVDIPPKSFSVLLTLAERRGQIVSKEELLEAVWPGTVVEENNLARAISTLRKALGETSGQNRFILTVPGRGYGFVADEPRSSSPDPGAPLPTNESFSGHGTRLRGGGDRPAKAIAALGSIAVVALLWIFSQARSVEQFEPVRTRSIFTSRQYPSAALSPDGKSVVYAAGETGNESIRLRLMESGREVELLPASKRSYGGLTFAPDGKHVFYIENSRSAAPNVLFEFPISGGTPREIVQHMDSPPALSPDGSQLAFVRESKTGESRLLIRRLADGKEEELVTVNTPRFLDYPAWSPNGRFIAFTEVTSDGVFLKQVELGSRQQRAIGRRWNYIRGLAWLPKGDDFLVSASEPETGSYSIWKVGRASGFAKRITVNADSFHSVAVAAGGTLAMTVAERSLMAVWVGTPGGRETWREILPAADSVKTVSWTADGKILAARREAKGQSIHLVSPDTKEKQQILAPGPYHHVRLCADGRTLIYSSTHSDRPGLWVNDLSLGHTKQLLALSGDTAVECRLRDRFVSFVSSDPQLWPGIWKISLDGGEPARVAQRAGFGLAVSPDGRYAASFGQDGAASAQRKATHIDVLPLDGSKLEKHFNVATTVSRNVPLRWLPGEEVITYADSRDGATEIWGQRLSGGPPRQITNFSGGLIGSFDWSPDGRQLVVSRGMRSFELILLEFGDYKGVVTASSASQGKPSYRGAGSATKRVASVATEFGTQPSSTRLKRR